MVHDAERLKELQALDLNHKIMITQTRIIEWYEKFNGNVYISFSGGKDSTVLLNIARQIYPNIPAVFSNTGLEYYEIQKFAKQMGATFIAPKIRFDEVVSTYGYPLISKEVSEAIYYARRICSQPVQVERESRTEVWRKRRELLGARRTNFLETGRLETNGNWWGGGESKPYHDRNSGEPKDDPSGPMDGICPQAGRTSREIVEERTGQQAKTSRGKWGNYHRRSLNPDESNPADKECFWNKRKQTDWSNWRMGAFSNHVEQFGEKSQFNKEKYLPLVYTPFLISHMCCSKMKKGPLKAYQRKTKAFPILATMADESRIRKQAWIRHGCNAFDSKHPMSQPLSFWTEQDVLAYIVRFGLDICPVYGEIVSVDADGNQYSPVGLTGDLPNLQCTGCKRTGCVFCGFGFHNEKGKTRFQLLAEIEPRKYEYALQGGAVRRQSVLRSYRAEDGRRMGELESEKDLGSFKAGPWHEVRF